ncbi:hypothetical protein EYF88_08800 [Paracoccus sediminis]|uniref:Uncharacterized protein n=1 Tax=Paracoccus sediminis TaxID=1214787 RepID=A0ABY1YLC6_9RHOB|nr:hypothetical protein [Paracoccus sediminis]TBN50988.1 hypothetical protein EYF88_08800 [Paracoccus sediminis]
MSAKKAFNRRGGSAQSGTNICSNCNFGQIVQMIVIQPGFGRELFNLESQPLLASRADQGQQLLVGRAV